MAKIRKKEEKSASVGLLCPRCLDNRGDRVVMDDTGAGYECGLCGCLVSVAEGSGKIEPKAERLRPYLER